MRADIKQRGWAVVVVGADKTVPLTGTGSMPAIFARRCDAREFMQENRCRMRSRLRVVACAARVELDLAA